MRHFTSGPNIDKLDEKLLTEQNAAWPVILLGGQQNALSLTRSFGRKGISVVLSSKRGCVAEQSRYCGKCFSIPPGSLPEDYWKQLLIESRPDSIVPGSVIISCSDEAVSFVAENYELLQPVFKLEINNPSMQHAMLDKQETIKLARLAGLPAPSFVPLNSINDIDAALECVEFPALLKPLQTHVFSRVFGDKMVLCDGSEQLRSAAKKALAANVPCMVTEFIPGGDHKLSGYHTYIDGNGERRFEFTKRLFRRYPEYFGMGVNHLTVDVSEIIDLSRRFFEHIDYRGIGNIEFKYDDRDGQWKIIECNPRFTAIQELILQSGLDTGALVYGDITGRRVDMPTGFRKGISLIHIEQDFRAFLALRRSGKLAFSEWFSTIPFGYVKPYFSWTDPKPVLKRFYSRVKRFLARKFSVA